MFSSRSRPYSSRPSPGSRRAATWRACGPDRHGHPPDRLSAHPGRAALAVLAAPLVRLVSTSAASSTPSDARRRRRARSGSPSASVQRLVLMLTRGFFSLQQPPTPTKLAVGSLAINAVGSYLLAKPFGIPASCSARSRPTSRSCWPRRCCCGARWADSRRAQRSSRSRRCSSRRHPGGHDLRRLVRPGRRSSAAALIAQIVTVFTAWALGSPAYAGVVIWDSRIPEARQILDLFARRLRRRSST